ncbi:putative dipeptidase [Aspergillus fischeri NRRL 181]|uniref:Dipeptidase n=1 Tax=Neosartorya fischeri (strain ATCC 1020 / DSM 3700 / CBS 544.65 / FGSC A1164 / JCM 1740 / NRRL 181 / WB 181) TaxID=331117 RepID=A1DNJ9_NEOFI|nr:dipeptidase [Aspergillus fischeri NRRL 181]EAW16370.1 dipeptidase [Aspergillus fischeri NRRL 181]
MVSRRLSAPLSIDQRVDKILSGIPMIDGHDDLPISIRAFFNDKIYADQFTVPFTQGNLKGHVDLRRLSKGKVGGTSWSVYVECPKNWEDFSDATYTTSVRQTFEQVDPMSRLANAYPDTFSSPPNGTTALQAFLDGKIISPYGIEGLHLSHGSIKKAVPHWHGISEAGKDLVYEMSRMGMIVDLAHVSVDTMRDVLGADELPKTDMEHAALGKVADHIKHIGGLIGFKHIGLDSDFDGIPTVPRGLEDVDEDAAKVAGGNLLRVWKRVDEVALQMQAEGALPVEDNIVYVA